MQLKVDLHVHTTASPDGLSSLQEMVDAAVLRGLDGIAITDHDCPFKESAIAKIQIKKDILLIPGIEVTTALGHLLVLRPRRNLPLGIPFLDAIKAAVADGSVPIIPHPTDPFSHGVGESAVRSSLPFNLPLEALNASTLGRYNRSAMKLANAFSLPKVGGSDAHMDRAVGDAYTIMDCDQHTEDGILGAIKAGRTSAAGKQTPIATMALGVYRRLTRRKIKENPP